MKEHKKNNKKYLIYAAGITGACALSFILLGLNDGLIFLKWAAFMIIIGMLEYPLMNILFDDYMPVDKILGIVIPGFLTWIAGIIFHIPFTGITCLAAIIIPYIIVSIIQSIIQKKQLSEIIVKPHIKYEAIFFFMFLFWTYLIGFNPEAYGTEKFMDYGFLQGMIVSPKLPPEDIWYAGEPINYYYGGQFFAAFIAKLTNTTGEYAYNMMRALIPALMFTGIFGIVEQMVKNKTQDAKRSNLFAVLSASVAVFAGNGHYIVYGLIKPMFNLNGEYKYWFPDSTRYIGYNPPNEVDQTIHEFPCYSFVLGDLHAHMINIMLVVLIIALLYSLIKSEEKKYPKLFVIGLVWGLCNWTNYWDYIIYIVVICITVIISNIISSKPIKDIIKKSIMQIGIIVITGIMSALPFTLNYDSVFKGVELAKYHTPFYQLFILWGIPFILSSIFLFLFLKTKEKTPEDVFCFILTCCAMGLVIIPEIVYVKDIYEATHARANTMFKLTYQSFIMFSVCCGYIIALFVTNTTQKVIRVIGYTMAAIHIILLGYFFNAASGWFNYPGTRIGTNALNYLDKDEFKEEKNALLWLKEKTEKEGVKGVVSEAPGDSYTAYERVSVITGAPTVAGWTVHEWLWRDSYTNITERASEVDQMYLNPGLAKKTIKKYGIKYIFFGQREKERYGERCRDGVISLGNTIYKDDGAVIVEIP